MDNTRSAPKPDQLLAEITDQIVEHFDPQQIILFGSYARGEARAGSDLDLLIVAPSDEPRWQRVVPVYRLLVGLGVPKEIVWWTPDEIAEWRERREAKEFRGLCRRIYQANYQRAYYWRRPDLREANIKRCRARSRASIEVRTCRSCKAQWCNVPMQGRRRGRPPTLYCSKTCRVRWHNKQLEKQRSESGFWKDNWRRWHKPRRRK